MNILRGLSIPKRLWLLLVVAILGFVLVLSLSLNQLKHTLITSKEDNTRMLVQTAYSVVEKNFQLFQQGQLTESQAQQASITEIQALRYDKGNYFWINDMQPKMIMHPTNPALNGKDISNTQDPTGKALFSEMVKVVKEDGEGLVPYMWPLPGSKEPIAKISYVKGFKPWGWIIGSGVYLQDIEEAYSQAATVQIGLVIIVLIIFALGAVLIIRSITLPLEEVVKALKDIASGEKDLSKRLPHKGQDEVSELSYAFNQFAEQIEVIINQVKQATIQLNASTTHLNQVVDQSEESLAQQQAQSSSVMESVQNLTASVEKISQSATDAIQAAKETQVTADEGENLVSQAKDSVATTAGRVREASTVISQLAQNSQSISGVLDVIRGIAEQTNLLALNAAIEAARAGEQGRGFAVVADEVRALAAKTQASTEEIRSMIDALQAGSNKAVQAISSGEESTSITVNKADTAAHSLQQIVGAINQIGSLNKDISSEVQAQYAVSEEVTDSIQRITESTQSSYESIQSTARSCQELTHMSKKLTQLVEQFKV